MSGADMSDDVNTPAKEYLPTDAFLKCGDRVWSVHRALLAERSPLFERHFDDSSKPSTPSITIGNQVVSAVHAALRYIYAGDYDDEDYDLSEYERVEQAYPILFNVYVHALAVKLEMPDLQHRAIVKFYARAICEWQTPGFADAVREIYTECPETRAALKSKVMHVCRYHATELFGVGTSVDSDSRIWYHKLNNVLNTVPEFRRDLLLPSPPSTEAVEGVWSEQTDDVSYLCPRCNETFAVSRMSLRRREYCWCPYCGAKEATENVQRQDVRSKQDEAPHMGKNGSKCNHCPVSIEEVSEDPTLL